jgi:hypothetical protein
MNIKKKILLFIIILIGTISYGQKTDKTDLIATWKLIENAITQNENNIDIGELVIFDKKGDTTEIIKGNPIKNIDKRYPNRYLKIDKKYATYYFYGNGNRQKYDIQNDVLRIDEYGEFQIVKLTKNYMILKGNKELHYEKVDVDLSDYKLFKN